ncbi:MAG: bifunctional RNase H/acid phosphatase [Geodermatophilaceae bacterium]|nr:bifunctional RNase H/acid phosphatase [Geodermatophilaceae bacterium]MDQ3454918.1 bifunctional RNase H/acid phosphatase [Actinomycetota bacterium]
MSGGRLIVEADGGSRGNPGPAGYGVLVRDAATGELLAERAEAIGVATNNVAEYRGLIAGLAAAAEFDPGAVEVRMDSKLVVEQMSGRWKIKNADLQALALQAQRLARDLPRPTYRWIPREQNAHADRLANAAMDAAAGLSVASRHPRPESTDNSTVDEARTSWTPTTPKATTWLLRHGHTEHSAARRFSGHNDLALNALGEREAAAAAERLAGRGIAAIVSSPLRRTRQTADVVAEILGLPVTVDEDLAETNFGRWDGLTLAETRTAYPAELAAWTGSVDVAPPDGESFASVARRVRRARTRLLAAHPDQAVLVVSHVTPIKLIVAAALGVGPEVMFRFQLDPAGLSAIGWQEDGTAVVRLLNDTSHLPSTA